MRGVMPAFSRELWRYVAALRQAREASELAVDPAVRALLEKHPNSWLQHTLSRLAHAGYLKASTARGWRRSFWFERDCRVPEGEGVPCLPLPEVAHQVAGVRTVSNALMPRDTSPAPRETGPRFEFRQWPSRRGDLLYFKDGRITNLDGSPAEMETTPCT